MWYSIGIWRPYGNSYSTSPRCNSYKVYHYDHSTSDHGVSSANPANVCISTELHLRNRKPGIKEQIVEMVHNGVGVRIAPER